MSDERRLNQLRNDLDDLYEMVSRQGLRLDKLEAQPRPVMPDVLRPVRSGVLRFTAAVASVAMLLFTLVGSYSGHFLDLFPFHG